MTDPNYTAIAVLMDRSGSMESVRSDAEGALQAFIEDQRALPGTCTIRLADFDTEYQTIYPSLPIDRAPRYQLVPRGGTALLDSIHRLVTEFGAELSAMPEDRRPSKVLVVVQTDGEENSSKTFTREQVFALIEQQRRDYHWNFVFLGANQDAIAAGMSMGFTQGSSMTYNTSTAGMSNTRRSLSTYAGNVRAAASGAATMDMAFTEEDRLGAVATDD